MEIQHLVFRLTGILVGISLCYFAINIMRATKGASKGWKYFTIAGIYFFLFTVTSSIFTLLNIPVARMISHTLFIPGTIVLTASFAQMIEDFNIKRPAFLNPMIVVVTNVTLIVVLFILYGMFSDVILLPMLLTVVLFNAMLANLQGVVSTIYLWRATKRKIWLSLMVFMFLFMVGQAASLYGGQCCAEGAPLYGQPACATYVLDYIRIFPIQCSQTMVIISHIAYNTLTLGALLLAANFYYFWKKLAH